jgi:hypothetical protein
MITSRNGAPGKRVISPLLSAPDNWEIKMPVNEKKTKGYDYSDDMTSGIRMRSGLLVLLSSSTVALAFGISFYFALVSSQTAVTTQFPELAPIVTKLKTILVVNTFGFIAVIIASFWVLSKLITSKMFTSLGVVMAGLRKAAENRYPETADPVEKGPFGEFESTWNLVVRETRARESREIDVIEKVAAAMPSGEHRDALSKVVAEKKKRIGAGAPVQGEAQEARDADDPLFMQPV